MTRTGVTVVRVGGSLLSSRGFVQRLRDWLDAETTARPDSHFVLVVGGGKWVDAIRELDDHISLDDVRAHWLSIEIMDITAGLVHAMVPELQVVERFDELDPRLREPGVTLLKPHDFLARVEPTRPGIRLPASWSVTSDSIAGRLAAVLEANRLVLLKSVLPTSTLPTSTRASRERLESLADAGYVDAFFPKLYGELPPLEFHCLQPSVAES